LRKRGKLEERAGKRRRKYKIAAKGTGGGRFKETKRKRRKNEIRKTEG
jgi:hypothetical protein